MTTLLDIVILLLTALPTDCTTCLSLFKIYRACPDFDKFSRGRYSHENFLDVWPTRHVWPIWFPHYNTICSCFPDIYHSTATLPQVFIYMYDNDKLLIFGSRKYPYLPMECYLKFWGERQSQKPTFLKECMKLNWIFQKDGVKPWKNFPWEGQKTFWYNTVII